MRKANLGILMFILLILVSLDFYVFQGIKVLVKDLPTWLRLSIKGAYWGINVSALLVILGFFRFGWAENLSMVTRNFLMGGVFILVLSKLLMFIFLLLDDIVRLIKFIGSKFNSTPSPEPSVVTEGGGCSLQPKEENISRSDFLVKTGAIIASVPIISSSYGILSGAHDYRVRRERIVLPNLPKQFHGIKIAQISDIHSGSFFNKVAVEGGVDMLLGEKPDAVFFTGDLVNNKYEEMNEYVRIFQKVKAPLGVYSILGNHDYGMYVNWESDQARNQNLENLKQVHKALGWDLLLDEHRALTVDGESIAVLGVENWGEGFIMKGDLAKAHLHTDIYPVKLLLSHDPSHWDAIVRPQFKDIDMMFAGHTHGFQFGIEVGNFQWSPVQYRYKQWGGLYQEDNQRLYVNRGYGYLGFPGRIGMPPEITMIELVKG